MLRPVRRIHHGRTSPEQKNRYDKNEIKVFISHRESKCDECGEELGRQAWIIS